MYVCMLHMYVCMFVAHVALACDIACPSPSVSAFNQSGNDTRAQAVRTQRANLDAHRTHVEARLTAHAHAQHTQSAVQPPSLCIRASTKPRLALCSPSARPLALFSLCSHVGTTFLCFFLRDEYASKEGIVANSGIITPPGESCAVHQSLRCASSTRQQYAPVSVACSRMRSPRSTVRTVDGEKVLVRKGPRARNSNMQLVQTFFSPSNAPRHTGERASAHVVGASAHAVWQPGCCVALAAP